jgi:hypothetical protein
VNLVGTSGVPLQASDVDRAIELGGEPGRLTLHPLQFGEMAQDWRLPGTVIMWPGEVEVINGGRDYAGRYDGPKGSVLIVSRRPKSLEVER